MKKFILICTILTSFAISLPLYAQTATSGENENIAVDVEALEALLLKWQSESDLLAKAILAKQIQKILKVETDGLVGNKTIAAIKSAGVKREIAKPTREENAKVKLVLQVSEGIITQKQADAINAERSAIKEIRDKVKSGELTKEEAKGKLNEIKKKTAERVKPSKDEGGDKPKKSVDDGGSKPKKSKDDGGSKPKKSKDDGGDKPKKSKDDGGSKPKKSKDDGGHKPKKQ